MLKTSQKIWSPGKIGMQAGQMLRRIDVLLASDTWGNFIRSLLTRHDTVRGLKVAEVGCGSGTMALTLGLLGAEVTLIDFNAEVLEDAARIYKSLGCPVRILKADCLEAPGEGLTGAFDIVLSGGLAEHFEGAYRERCFAYHAALLNAGGIVMIGVPNRLSPFYQWIRLFRMATGTWGLDVEIPFSAWELYRMAGQAGLTGCRVFATASLLKDMYVYSRGFISAIADLLPGGIVSWARIVKAQKENKMPSAKSPGKYAERCCVERFEYVRGQRRGPVHAGLTEYFSSGLMLVGFKEMRITDMVLI